MTELFVAVVLSFSIVDGDTFDFKGHVWPGHMVDERVRLLRVNTPEKGGKAPACERELAAKAAEYTRARMAAAKVIMVRASGRDSFGRSLAEVFLDGVSLNDALIASGHARPYGIKGAWC